MVLQGPVRPSESWIDWTPVPDGASAHPSVELMQLDTATASKIRISTPG